MRRRFRRLKQPDIYRDDYQALADEYLSSKRVSVAKGYWGNK